MRNATGRPAGALSRTAARGAGERIRSLRLRLDRSRERFAALVGVPRETVEAWELGEGIGRDDLVLVADATGASLPWLIAGLTPERVEVIRALASQRLAPVPLARWQADRPPM